MAIPKVLLHPGRDPADPKLRSVGFGYIDTHGTFVIDKDDYDRVDAFQDTMQDPLARAVKGAMGVRGGQEVSVDRAGKFAALALLRPLRGVPDDDRCTVLARAPRRPARGSKPDVHQWPLLADTRIYRARGASRAQAL